MKNPIPWILCLLAIGVILAVILTHKDDSISKEKIELFFNSNYGVFVNVTEMIGDGTGTFFAQYVDSEIRIDTNIDTIENADKETLNRFRENVKFIMDDLHFSGIFKDEKASYVTFEAQGRQGIVFSNREPEGCEEYEQLRDKWYYVLFMYPC